MKYFGLFSFCAREGYHKSFILRLIYDNFVKHNESLINHDLIAINKTQLANSRSDERLKQFAASWRNWYHEDRKRSLCHMFSTKYIIHRCDENGLYIPSKKEITEAIELYSKNDPNPVEA